MPKRNTENWSTFLAISEALFALSHVRVCKCEMNESMNERATEWVCDFLSMIWYSAVCAFVCVRVHMMMCTRALSMHNMRLISDIYPSNAVDLQEIIFAYKRTFWAFHFLYVFFRF